MRIPSDSYENPKPDMTYMSPALPAFGNKERLVRIATKRLETDESYTFAKVKDEIVVHRVEGGATHIRAKFYQDDRGIFVLTLQRYKNDGDAPQAGFHVSLVGDQIRRFMEFLDHIHSMPLTQGTPARISDADLKHISMSNAQMRLLVQENPELLKVLKDYALTADDIKAVGFRKKQLEVFRRLLDDKAYFDEVKTLKRISSDERLWQRFFERNTWIFGYGLSYIPLSKLSGKKLEQYVCGATVQRPGKRVDALMKTRGIISSLVFAEIKTPEMPLLRREEYRTGCWAPHLELTEAVAQVQGTVSMAMREFQEKYEAQDDEGNPTGEEAFTFAPKSFLVAGNLSQMHSEHGTSKDRFRSFELFRRNTMNPEILTFDELYARAEFIVIDNEREDSHAA